MNFVIKTMKEYKATIAYFKKEYPKAYDYTDSFVKSLITGLIIELSGYLIDPTQIKLITAVVVAKIALRIAVKFVVDRLSTEVKTSKI